MKLFTITITEDDIKNIPKIASNHSCEALEVAVKRLIGASYKVCVLYHHEYGQKPNWTLTIWKPGVHLQWSIPTEIWDRLKLGPCVWEITL